MTSLRRARLTLAGLAIVMRGTLTRPGHPWPSLRSLTERQSPLRRIRVRFARSPRRTHAGAVWPFSHWRSGARGALSAGLGCLASTVLVWAAGADHPDLDARRLAPSSCSAAICGTVSAIRLFPMVSRCGR